MANEPDPQEDPNVEGTPPQQEPEPPQEAPAGPPPEDMDLSQFDDDPLGAPVVGDDDDAVKKMNRRTSTFGRVATLLIILVVLGFVGMWFWGEQKKAETEEKFNRISQLETEEEVTTQLRQLWPSVSSPEYKRKIIKNLGHYKDEQAIDIYIEGLEGNAPVRRASAWALARIGSPAADKAKPKLLEVLPKTDEKDRAQVAWTLALLGEPKASDAIIEQFSKGLLQNLDGFDPKVITEVLGPQKLGSEELLNHESESVRRLTAHALGEAASPEVVDPLSRLLDFELDRSGEDRSQEVIRAAAAGLGRTGSAKAARPLFAVLEEEPDLKTAVVDALKRSTAAPNIAVLANEASDVAVKRELVRLVAESHDSRVADDLAGWLESDDAEIKETSAFGLADLGDERAASVLLGYVQDEESGVSDQALGALQKVASPAISDQLLELKKWSEDNEGYRRASIVRIMAKTGNQDLGSEIEEVLETPDVGAAAISLAELGYEPAYDKLLGMVERPKDVEMGARNAAERSLENEDVLRERKGAIQAMGYYGNPEAFDALVKVVEDDVDEDYELRALAAQAIGRLASDEQLQTVIDKIEDESLDERSRRYYVQALWQKARPELSSTMLDLVGNDDMPIPVRRAAAIGVGYTADPANDQRLMDMLEQEGAARHAALAITLGGGRKAAEKLVETLANNNDVRDILQQSLMNDQVDWFNLLTTEMLENGQVFRRLQAADALREGDADSSFGYAWAQLIGVLRGGWNGPDGAQPRHVREALYAALVEEGGDYQNIAAEGLAAIPERGLLLRARDEGSSIAREMLRGKDDKK